MYKVGKLPDTDRGDIQQTCMYVLSNLGCRRCDLLQVSEAAVFVADEAPPQHGATTRRTLPLHWQEVGRLRPQEMFGEADHMTAHSTGSVETAQLF